MSSRVQRIVAIVTASSLTAASTIAVAREIRAADSLRTQQSGLMSDMVRALGAEPAGLPYGQVVTGLATRPIDGAANNGSSFVTIDRYKFAGYRMPFATAMAGIYAKAQRTNS